MKHHRKTYLFLVSLLWIAGGCFAQQKQLKVLFVGNSYTYNNNLPQSQAEIDRIYTMAAEEAGATRVPVGTAWQNALDIRPSTDLYNADGSHPSQLGTVLIASMFVKVITDELPESYPVEYNTLDLFGEELNLLCVDPLDSDFCRRIAEDILDPR